jgi:hypothetical protein
MLFPLIARFSLLKQGSPTSPISDAVRFPNEGCAATVQSPAENSVSAKQVNRILTNSDHFSDSIFPVNKHF